MSLSIVSQSVSRPSGYLPDSYDLKTKNLWSHDHSKVSFDKTNLARQRDIPLTHIY